MNNNLLKSTLIAALMMIALQASAQSVALVLSGGGAKGLSHVGVLKALEENNITIDYVVGNSMGAIIGGLYASGYSPKEIEEFVKSRDFKEWVTGRLNEQDFSNDLEDANASWINIPFSIESRIVSRLPSSIISSFLMDYAVMEVFAGPSAVASYDFDSLFVPFRCVASDIDSSQLVVLREGQLGTAIRASATFPLLIRPVKIDGKLLFDGGMYNNFPVDIAESEFAPDLIIGSKAVGNYDAPRQNDILSQLQNMLMRKADYTVPGENGILIESKMGPAGVLDFSRIDTYIDSGYIAALRQIPALETKLQRRMSTDSLAAERMRFRSKIANLNIGQVNVFGVNKKQARYIKNKFNFRNRYSKLDTLKAAYMSLLADDKISYIFPELVYNPQQGNFDLNLDVSLAKPFLAEVGGNVSSAATNQAFLGLYYRNLSSIGSRFGVNAYFGRFYSSVQGLARFDLPGAMPFFLETKATLSRKDYFRNATYFFEDPTPAFLINDETFLQLEVGHLIGKNRKVNIGFAAGRRGFEYYQTNVFGRNDTSDVNQFDFLRPQIRFEYNSLNRKYFSSAGMNWKIQASIYDGTQKNIPGTEANKSFIEDRRQTFFRLKLHYDNYFAHAGNWHFGLLTEAMITNQPLLSNYTATVLSAPVFEPVSEMKAMFLDNYRAFSYLAGGLKFIYSPARNIDIRMEGYVFQPYQRILDLGPYEQPEFGSKFSDQFYTFSSRVVIHTPLGPLSASLNYFDKSDNHFSAVVSFGYLIFNRSAFE
ncbi:MAG: patatin-like phospholipase family protein [Bacteroidetes bacterium]|jgi:NTE family protein|nr:patatin-like phospholipase family protein [Bacteroidota bacterium]